jgi:uncharacterized damage-inducible protein DinB
MQPEPWMRGPIPGVHPLLAPTLYSFQHAREDLSVATEGLTADQLWARPSGSGSIGFHIRHIGGSVERLITYLQNAQLSDEQLAALKAEAEPGVPRDQLLQELDTRLKAAELIVRALDPATLTEPRTVGRKKLPTTVIGLLVHISEHTMRHVGQAVTLARILR